MMIYRQKYVDEIYLAIDSTQVKILTGIRRSGKSTILKMIKNKMIEDGINSERILYINMEDNDLKFLQDSDVVYQYLKENLSEDGKTYIFIDEIQEIPNWAKIINSLNTMFNVSIFLTGSNSKLFSGEHLTYLTGRYIEFHIYPLSFNEFMSFNNGGDSNILYKDFQNGSFPGIVLERNEILKPKMLEALWLSIIKKDMELRVSNKNSAQFGRICKYIFGNIGNITSISKINNYLASDGTPTSYDTIDSYINLLESSFLLYRCPTYLEKGKTILKTNGKFYSVDIGLAKLVAEIDNSNFGAIFENFVYLELKKAGYKVYTSRVNKDYEIDFFAYKNNRKMFVQVSLNAGEKETLEREVRPFRYLNGNEEKYLVTFDPFDYNVKECKVINIFNFISIL